MSSEHFDFSGDALADPLKITRSPLDEPILALSKSSDLLKASVCLSMKDLVPYWHPRVSHKGDIPRVMGNAQFYSIIGQTTFEGDTSDMTHHAGMITKIIEFHNSIFINEASHTAEVCQNANHLAVVLHTEIIAVLSYVLDRENSSVVVTHLGVAEENRKQGYASFLFVALFKVLIGGGVQLDIHVVLQCLPVDHTATAMGFYTQFGFLDTNQGAFEKANPFGLTSLAKPIQGLITLHKLCIVVEADAEPLRWMHVCSSSFVIPDKRRKLLLEREPSARGERFFESFQSDEYVRFPLRSGMKRRFVKHCAIGLNLLFRADQDDNDASQDDVMCDNLAMNPGGYMSFLDRASISNESWLSTNVLDSLLAVMRFDKQVNYFELPSQMVVIGTKVIALYAKISKKKVKKSLTDSDGVAFTSNIAKLADFFLANWESMFNPLVFMPLNKNKVHWTGMFGINPLVVLEPEAGYFQNGCFQTQKAFGWLYFDSLKTSGVLNAAVPDSASNPFFFLCELMATLGRTCTKDDTSTALPSWGRLGDFDKWMRHMTPPQPSSKPTRLFPQFCDKQFNRHHAFPRYVSTVLVENTFDQHIDDGCNCGYYVLLLLVDLHREIRANSLMNFESTVAKHVTKKQPATKAVNPAYTIGHHVDQTVTNSPLRSQPHYSKVKDLRLQVLTLFDRLAFTITENDRSYPMYRARLNYQKWLSSEPLDISLGERGIVQQTQSYTTAVWTPIPNSNKEMQAAANVLLTMAPQPLSPNTLFRAPIDITDLYFCI